MILGLGGAAILAAWLFLVPSPSERKVGTYQECVREVNNLLTYEFLSDARPAELASDKKKALAAEGACPTYKPDDGTTYGEIAVRARENLNQGITRNLLERAGYYKEIERQNKRIQEQFSKKLEEFARSRGK